MRQGLRFELGHHMTSSTHPSFGLSAIAVAAHRVVLACAALGLVAQAHAQLLPRGIQAPPLVVSTAPVPYSWGHQRSVQELQGLVWLADRCTGNTARAENALVFALIAEKVQ